MFKPFGARVAVLLDEAPSHVGVIALPDKAKKPPAEGTIMAVGDGDVDWNPLPFYAGQRVVVSPYGGHAYRYEGKDYLIMVATDILAVLPDPEPLLFSEEVVDVADAAAPEYVAEMAGAR